MSFRGPDDRLNLHDYQKIAVDHLLHHPRAGLFLDMGLGKTAVTLSALTPEHLPALVVAPKRVAENVWETECRKWRPDLCVSVVMGTPAQRQMHLRQPADIHVIGRDNLADALQFMGKQPWRTFVLDELSGFKSRSSIRWKTAKKISAMPHVWGLTGTPSPNGLMDLWAQLYILDGGERLGSTLTSFRKRYFYPGRQLPNGVIIEWILRDGADKKIHSKIDDICLSMDSDGRIDLPPVTYNDVIVPMSPNTRRLYKQLKEELVVNLGMLGEVHTAPTAASLSSRLSQISAGFIYVDPTEQNVGREGEYDVIHKDKVTALREIIDGTGSPVLVFYRFRAEKEMIQRELGELVSTIDEPDVITRWNAGQVPVLLAHPASAGHGLNLQYGGHTIVWTSLTWSLEEWEQGNKRLARQGQEHPVVIHTLMTPRAVDGAIAQRLQLKTSVQDALLAHLESPL